MPTDDPAPSAWSFSEAERLACLKVLRELREQTATFLDRSQAEHSAWSEVRAEANRLIAAIQGTVRARRRLRGKKPATAELPPLPSEAAVSAPSTPVCYICRRPLLPPHPFYAALCALCGELNWTKRENSADLSGRVALVTGGRRGIGYQVALKLLRAGARVEVTTRFPCDAALRYAREKDLDVWADRLRIHGLDLRVLPALERFIAALLAEGGSLNVLINNAAQTVRRPPVFYAHLLPTEQQGSAALPGLAAALVCPGQYHAAVPLLAPPTPLMTFGQGAWASGLVPPSATASALLPLVPLLPGDELSDASLFPPGQRDETGQQLDLRTANSWSATVGEVPLVELAEVHCVNAFAPFVLLNGLLPALRRSSWTRRFVVNVSSREGWFERNGRESIHPHTNMAKASLNMLTRTVAPDLAEERIFVCSVDPGWVSDQRPVPTVVQRRKSGGFLPPLDEVDGAARVLDPIFTGVQESATPLFGRLYRDYQPVHW
jgi:NAD(P)-dependent dehydrogenase (short-subunit alcohol dehydrogenase family)